MPVATADSSPAVEGQPGQSYGPGTRLLIPQGRASFVIPAGWQAQRPDDSETIVAVSDSGAGFIMVFMLLHMTEEQLTELLAEPQPLTHDLVFEPTGTVAKKGNRLTASYESGSLSGRALAVMGPDQAVLFFLGSPHTDSGHADRVLDELADSTEFPAPQ
ncbi:hypothetical protein [Nitrospira moscoviensis]|uniref:hypothetical protein n=1 Tax=Nitrospira moscoviensis TaxID=42253 RepID=UPI0011AE3AD6|nr:hypothetical protein [Nitrospira moscoviensis]